MLDCQPCLQDQAVRHIDNIISDGCVSSQVRRNLTPNTNSDQYEYSYPPLVMPKCAPALSAAVHLFCLACFAGRRSRLISQEHNRASGGCPHGHLETGVIAWCRYRSGSQLRSRACLLAVTKIQIVISLRKKTRLKSCKPMVAATHGT